MVPATTAREDHQREHAMNHQQQTQQEKAQDGWEEVGAVTIYHFLMLPGKRDNEGPRIKPLKVGKRIGPSLDSA